MMWYWSSGVHWWGFLFGFLLTVAFWGVLVWVVLALVGSYRSHREPPATRRDDDPAQILARRFAAGEIDEAEFRDRLAQLHEAGLADGDRGRNPSGTGSSPRWR
ncbi:MAG TPA: SHOCT domain-containing protein [Acidimicrobiales bacterium]|nr:SHOCT domain-containing protein [Acidimicrobiales bacterium]